MGDYWRLEPCERDLECEHSTVDDDLELHPCHKTAEWYASTPMWSDETRSRFCDEHIETEFERKLSVLREQRHLDPERE